MPAHRPSELPRIKPKTWQSVLMMSKHSAHLTPLLELVHLWLWLMRWMPIATAADPIVSEISPQTYCCVERPNLIYTYMLHTHWSSISTYYILSHVHFWFSFPEDLRGYRISGWPGSRTPLEMSKTFPVLVSWMTSSSTFQRDTLSPNGFNTILFPPSETGQHHGYTLFNNHQIQWWANKCLLVKKCNSNGQVGPFIR